MLQLVVTRLARVIRKLKSRQAKAYRTLDGWPAPAASFVKRSNCDKFGQLLEACMSDVNGCCWPRFQLRPLGRLGSLARRFLTSTHLAPSFCEPGRGSHPDICDFQFPIVDLNHFISVNRQLAIGNRQFTKILPAFAGVLGVHAPVSTSQFLHLCRVPPQSLHKRTPRCLSKSLSHDKLDANRLMLF